MPSRAQWVPKFLDVSTLVPMLALALVFSITTLYLFVLALLYLAFEDTSSLGFVETGDLEDLGGIQICV